MKTLLILVGSVLVGCSNTSMPQFPSEIEHQYMVDIPGGDLSSHFKDAIVDIQAVPKVEEIACFKFKIVSTYPYKIKFEDVVPLMECNHVGGFKPKHIQSLVNWMDDVYEWAQSKKKCFK